MDLDYDPLEDAATTSRAPGQAIHQRRVLAVAERQEPFFTLSSQFQALFYELPKITTREVEVRIRAMHETYLETCERVGISKMSIPQLKDCCGRERVWLDERLPAPSQAPATPKKSGLGDLIAKITGFFGIKPCEECKRRQAMLNKFRWPWGK
jgi:hypothetical protein